MKTLTALGLTLALCTVGYGQKAAPAQGTPPKNLKQAPDGRWTANADPANPERFEVHVVQLGDTLSLLSGRYLGNIRLWPQLWEMNDHIVNPHWIYPNDRILIKPVTVITQTPTPPPAAPAPEPEPEPAPAPRSAPVLPPMSMSIPQEVRQPQTFEVEPPRKFPQIKSSDLYCSGFVREEPLPGDLKVLASHGQTGGPFSTDGDYVYLSRGSAGGVNNGRVLTIVRPTRRVDVPASSPGNVRVLGMHYLEIGQVQVVMSQPEFSTARVINSCDAIEAGDRLIPFQRASLPDVQTPRTFNVLETPRSPIIGSVAVTLPVLSNYGSALRGVGVLPGVAGGSLKQLRGGIASEGQVVYVDVGQDSGVRPGDSMLVFRGLPIDRQLYRVPADAAVLNDQRMAVGEVIILKVEKNASTALVTYSADWILAGDAVVRR